MSYTVLARRYRSNNFDQLVGQDHVAQTLKKAISSGRIAHAYLFCGTRGTGKTSSARIMAKALNCQAAPGPTPDPCGTCDSCTAIAKGQDIDVIEIDAASNTGVDNIREVIENSQYRPAHSRFKIYIIDEVHMLSKSAFNALLKTLEEPPEHVKFILATTEPEKVLPTILSRCQRYDFRNIPTREIAAHLKSICQQEKIKADDDALLLVAKAGAGSMRDALSLLDRLLSLGEKDLTVDMIEQLLGMPKSGLIFDLAQRLGEGDVKGTLEQAEKLITGGLSADTLIATLVDHLRNLLILRTCGPESHLVEVPGLPMKDLVAQADRFDAVVLTQDITILEELRRTLRQTQAGRALLDATLVRLALADQFASVADLLGRADGQGGNSRTAAAGAQKKNAEPVAARPVAHVTSAPGTSPAPPAPQAAVAASPSAPGEGAVVDPWQSATDAQVAPDAQGTPATPAGDSRGAEAGGAGAPAAPTFTPAPVEEGGNDDLPAVGKVWSGPSLGGLGGHRNPLLKPRSPAPPAQAPPPAGANDGFNNVTAVDPNDFRGVWRAVLGMLSSQGPGLQALVAAGTYGGTDGNLAIVRYATKDETFVKMLDRGGKKELVRDALTKILNKPVGLKFELVEGSPAAPAPVAGGAPQAGATVVAQSPRAGLQTAPPPPPPTMPVDTGPRLTPEIREQLRTEPWVKAVLEQFGGDIVKLEDAS
jgi:DNA polymerase-3 subunit gamma/tau